MRFRDWAEEVLYGVMTGSGYDLQNLRTLIEPRLKSIGRASDDAVNQVCDLIVDLRSIYPLHPTKPAKASLRVGQYITAIDWLRKYYPRYYYPKMNFGGKFEGYVAKQYLARHGRWPEHLESPRLNAWLYREQQDKRFLEESLFSFYKEEFLKGFTGPKALPLATDDSEEV